MGKVLEYRVARIECERRSCSACARLGIPDTRDALIPELARLVEEGWSFILRGKLMAYCPAPACQAKFRMRLQALENRQVYSVDSSIENLNDVAWTRGVDPSPLALMMLPTSYRQDEGSRNV